MVNGSHVLKDRSDRNTEKRCSDEWIIDLLSIFLFTSPNLLFCWSMCVKLFTWGCWGTRTHRRTNQPENQKYRRWFYSIFIEAKPNSYNFHFFSNNISFNYHYCVINKSQNALYLFNIARTYLMLFHFFRHFKMSWTTHNVSNDQRTTMSTHTQKKMFW